MMIGQVGSVASYLAVLTALYAAAALAWGARKGDPRWISSGRNGLVASTALFGLGLILLTIAFLTDQFQLRYVANHSSLVQPLYLKLTAVWAGQEGSLLLWSFLQALFAAILIRPVPERGSPLLPWAGAILGLVVAFFGGITALHSNPFALSAMVPGDGAGMSPLLRHPGMIFHPPSLYVGYVALAIPFALALAAVITGRFDEWPAAARRWTVTAWLFLGIGIFLGARWAYDVLGWGGYWGWDPVENAALMPWLTSTALLHSLAVQQERNSFRLWNYALSTVSFLLVLFGTFATRSGLIESVHAFARSSLGGYFMGAMILVAVASILVAIWRPDQLRAPESSGPTSLLSRQDMFMYTLVLLMMITLSVMVGSILPTITEVLGARRMEAGPEWFDRVTGPQFGLLVLLMGVCPLAGYWANAAHRLGRRLVIPAVVALLAVVASALLGFQSVGSFIGFAVVGLALATTAGELWLGVAQRQEGEGLWTAFIRAASRNRRCYGGMLVHMGIVLMAIGVIGTRMHSTEQDLSLRIGQPTQLGNYTLVFQKPMFERRADHNATMASFDLYRQGAYQATLQPQVHLYANDTRVTVPALRMGVREDVYMVLGGISQDGGTATVRLIIDPLINFLWMGGLVFILGGVVSLWPTAERAPGQRRLPTSLVLVSGAVLFALATWAMWGGGHGASTRPEGRPLVGQPAPPFLATTLEGETVSLDAGKVTVVNFWATWCEPCATELPALEATWRQFADRGVTMVGLAFQETGANVRAAQAQYGLTFDLALDAGDAIAATYGITGIPETFVMDQEGKVAYVHIGPVTYDQLSQELEMLLAGAGQ